MPTFVNGTTKMITVPFFVEGNRKFVNPGEVVITDHFYTEAEAVALGFTWTAVTPYYEIVLASETLTFGGAGSQTTSEEYRDCPVIRIVATAAVTVKANNAAGTTSYPVAPNVAIELDNDRKIDALVVTATGVAVVNVAGLRS